MAPFDQDSDITQWAFTLFDTDPPSYSGYFGGSGGEVTRADVGYDHVSYHYRIADSSNVESDEMIAKTLQEEFSKAYVNGGSQNAPPGEELWRETADAQDWRCNSTSNYCSDHEHSHEDYDDRNPSTSGCSPDYGEHACSPEFADNYGEYDEVGNRLNQLVCIPHVPRINGDIPSVDEATSDHERLLNRLQLYRFVEVKVQGDGNCQFRALSDQLYHTPDRHELVRSRAVDQLKSHSTIYEGYVPMEYGDYVKKMSESGEWGDHVTLQAVADAYGVRILVMTSFKDTCYIEILPIDEKPKGVVFLSFWAEVHYNSIYFQDTAASGELKKKKKWWSFGTKK